MSLLCSGPSPVDIVSPMAVVLGLGCLVMTQDRGENLVWLVGFIVVWFATLWALGVFS